MGDAFFGTIDTEEKAYILGCIALNGVIYDNSIIIETSEKNNILYKIQKILQDVDAYQNNKFFITKSRFNKHFLTISSQTMRDNIVAQIGFGIRFPIFTQSANIDDKLIYAFIRGYFDCSGYINIRKKTYPEAIFKSSSWHFLCHVRHVMKIPCTMDWNTLVFKGINSIDFLGKLYGYNPSIYSDAKYNLYKRVLKWKPRGTRNQIILPKFKYVLMTDKAIAPKKANISDAGWDVHIVRKIKEENGIIYYGTDLQIQPDPIYYFDLVARSSLCKYGYILANSVGIIDNAYTGEIIIPLAKIGNKQIELNLPIRAAQLIPRRVINMVSERVLALDNTSRSVGGFGSTGK